MQLGRLLMSTVFNQKEVTTTDSVSRFFLDNWLAKNGSDSRSADTLSLDLMCGLQRALAKHKYNRCNYSLDENENENEIEIEIENENYEKEDGGDDFASPTPLDQNIVTAVALEALDRLIEEFGNANPILKDIRDAILPAIYASMTTTEDSQGEGEEKADDVENLNSDSASRPLNPPEKNMRRTEDSVFIQHDFYPTKENRVDEIVEEKDEKLSGKSYLHYCTWRDKNEEILTKIIPTEKSLKTEKRKNEELRTSSSNVSVENEKMKKLLEDNKNQLTVEVMKSVLLEAEKNKYEDVNKSQSLKMKEFSTELLELKVKREVESAQAVGEKNLLLSTIKELEHSLKSSRLKVDDVSIILQARDKSIKESEKNILQLKSAVSDMR